jgi:hypothetical protein
MASRYAITASDLKTAALQLKLGEGLAARFATTEVDSYIDQAEEWAEDQVSDFIAVPLKPTPVRGSTTVAPTLSSRNYPRDFILAVIYWSVARLMNSEYFANEPNASEAGKWAEETANDHIRSFRSRTTVLVGGGRRRNPNPHMPPNIAPKENFEQQG